MSNTYRIPSMDFLQERNEMSSPRLKKLSLVVSVLLYASYFIAGSSFLFADSPALISFLGSAYRPWSALLWIGGVALVTGMVSKRPFIEVVGTLPTAFAVFIYALAVLTNPPGGQNALGLALFGLISGSSLWLVMRFISIYSKLGKNDPREV